jgi:hypothetical protein
VCLAVRRASSIRAAGLGALLVFPMPVAASWIRPHLAKLRNVFDG